MKKILLFGIIAVAAASCSSSKSALESQNQLLMMQMQQQQIQQQQQQLQQQQQQAQQPQYAEQRPHRVARTIDPCMEMAQAESENLRAYGTAKAYVEGTALNEAERDARNRLAYMIKTAVEGAAQDYAKNANTNLETTTSTISEVVMTQFVSQEIANTRVIKTSIFDLADGSIEVYVCLEMTKPQVTVEESISNILDNEDVLKTEYDRERFIAKMNEGLTDYKNSISQE